MRTKFLLASLLAVAALLTGCTNEEDFAVKNPEGSRTYTATAIATKDDGVADEETRALFVGGNTFRYANMWDKGDQVLVYKDGTNVGTLSPSDADQGTKQATLSGSLTGEFSVGDEVTLYLTSKTSTDRGYAGQTGNINDLSANYSYQTQTVHVAAISGDNITLTTANMNHQQAYVYFELTDADTGKRLHPSTLVISADSTAERPYRIVTFVDADGTESYGNLAINATKTDGEYPSQLYAAILNEGFNASSLTHQKVNYHFDAMVDGKVYTGPATALYAAPGIGKLSRIRRAMTQDKNAVMTIAPTKAMVQGTTSLREPAVMIGNISILGKCRNHLTYSSSNPAVATVDATTGEVTAVAEGTTVITVSLGADENWNAASASYTVTVQEPVAEDESMYVDLGVSVLWARMNVGATTETDFGTYFAWGETLGYTDENNYDKHSFFWSNYKYNAGRYNYETKTDEVFLTKYVMEANTDAYGYNGFYDNKSTLDLEDDAAHANWGGNWRMPTYDEFDELYKKQNNSHYKFEAYDGVTTIYNNAAGVAGLKITYLDTGASIFLPAAGLRVDGSSSVDALYAGTCRYWCSSLRLDGGSATAHAKLFYTGRNSAQLRRGSGSLRRTGHTVRAVLPKPSN